jgi:cytosine/adenosine deaminase-related metal-dependent hydrolase
MIAPSAPQRCSRDLMLACMDLAVDRGVPFHTHVLETKTQAVTGHELYGKSLVAYMNDLGLLKRNTTFAHSVWVSDDDMRLMGEAGISIAHNAVSNQSSVPAFRQSDGCWMRALQSASAPMASAPTIRRVSSTSCAWRA